jgi:hypothetical protein
LTDAGIQVLDCELTEWLRDKNTVGVGSNTAGTSLDPDRPREVCESAIDRLNQVPRTWVRNDRRDLPEGERVGRQLLPGGIGRGRFADDRVIVELQVDRTGGLPHLRHH